MKIQITNYQSDKDNISLTIRVEQEDNGYCNSVIDNITFNKADYPNLTTDDDFKTLAFRKLKLIYERVFEATGYVEEVANPIDFKIVEPIIKTLKIIGQKKVTKIIGEDLVLSYFLVEANQFKETVKNRLISLDDSYVGITLNDGILTISNEEIRPIVLKAMSNGIVTTFVIDRTIQDQIKEIMTYEQMDEMVTFLAGGNI